MAERKKPAAKKRSTPARGRTIDAEASRPGGRGAKPKPEPPKSARDLWIWQMHASGKSAPEIAERTGLSRRRVDQILKRLSERRTALETAPAEIVEEALRSYDQQLETYGELLVDYAGRPETKHLAISALRGYGEVYERRMAALSAMGKLPTNLEVFRMESELARLGQLVLDALQMAADGKVSIAEAQERVRALVSRRELPVIDASGR